MINQMQALGNIRTVHDSGRNRALIPAVAVMAAALAAAGILLLYANGSFESYPYLFLLPWIAGLTAVMAAPSAVLYYQGKFSLAHPIVFATWSYFFPAFGLGGLFFAGGWSDPVFLPLIQDADTTLPFTIFLIGLGFTGLCVGFFTPTGRSIGRYLARKLPFTDLPIQSYTLPSTLLLVIGSVNTFIAFAVGLFGYQNTQEFTSYDGIVFLSTLFWFQACFMIWFLYFRATERTPLHYTAIALVVITSFARALFAGNRGTIVQIFTFVLLAYVLSGRRFGLRQGAISAALLSVGLLAGMIYGTSFRAVKGGEATQDVSHYTDSVIRTIDELGKTDLNNSIEFGLSSMTGRMDILSTVAVVVSNYEQLAPYEEAYGFQNNIIIDLTTFFIPRIVWKDKPYASDPRRYSELYFNFGDSSFAITPVADLLRNFGVPGVFLGMFVLGFILRVVFSSLIEDQKPAVWRVTLYFILLTVVSYEGFFGTIIPSMFKTGLTAIFGLVLVNFVAKRIGNSRVKTYASN